MEGINLNKSPRTRIKCCGLRRAEDIEMVNAVNADFAGFIMSSRFWRYTEPAKVKELHGSLKKGIMAVGVFVDEPVEYVAEQINNGTIDIAQLHGAEDDEYIKRLRELIVIKKGSTADADISEADINVDMNRPAKPGDIIKAFKIQTAEDIERAAASTADYILLDSGTGTGQTFDWRLMTEIKRPYFFAGGLNPGNVSDAVRHFHPYAVDVSSGIETEKVKDAAKVADFAANVRAAQEEIMTNERGRFGIHGGQYIPETLMNAVIELEKAYEHYKDDPEFNAELTELFNNYAGRPSRLYYAKKLTRELGGAKIYLKREDLNHTGAHKINNVLGQALLAKKMGKTRLIAETGAGQHGVATATAAALMDMECVVFMGKEDTERQALNVYRMKLLGAEVVPVTSGTATLKDAVSEAMREWTSRIADTHYCLGSVMGPHPFPTIVRDFQAVISKEIKTQILEAEGRLPDVVMACVGGGSNAIGTFYNFIEDKDVRLIGCEAAGRGIDTYETAATINTGRLGIFHGMKSYFCQDKYGQIAPVYSISAGLDYPGIGPEHAYLHDIGRAEYVAVTDDEAVNAFEYLSKTEGIIPAIESAHAVAYAMKLAPKLDKDKIIVITISGRGDKDVAAIARYRGEDLHE